MQVDITGNVLEELKRLSKIDNSDVNEVIASSIALYSYSVNHIINGGSVYFGKDEVLTELVGLDYNEAEDGS